MKTAPRILILDEPLVNKIAAGEVIERPASIAKELIENSIDAGAKRITIEVHQSGKKLIRITDDGEGMTPEEVKLSVERHATSKIKSAEDLFDLHTLGFRGEALPSIGAVSRLEIISKDETSQLGSHLVIEGGKTVEIKTAGSPAGTTAIVRNLFYNTPARRKFLRSEITEFGHIGDTVARFILAYPEVSFRLIHNGTDILTSPGTGNLADAVAAVYGSALFKGMIPLKDSSPAISLEGLIGNPQLTRSDRQYQSLFINRRLVRNPLITRTVEDIYRTRIPSHRNPVFILSLNVDPREVDVNVHPTKREVRFAKTNEVLNFIRKAVEQTLAAVNPVEPDRLPDFEFRKSGGTPQTTPIWQKDLVAPFTLSVIESSRSISTTSETVIPLFQLNQTYILATSGQDLYIIDQHVAHERIIFEQLKSKENLSPESQSLLVPDTFTVTPKESAMLIEHRETFENWGFVVEEFGNNAFILRAAPVILGKTEPRRVLMEILGELIEGASVAKDLTEKVKIMLACHAAVKAGDRLSDEQMLQLVNDLFSTPNPLTCPHGRPIILKISQEELEKKFGRK